MGQEIATPVKVPEPQPHTWKVGPLRSGFLVGLPVLLLLYVVFAARGVHEAATDTLMPLSTANIEPIEPNGAMVYAQNCARCHGIRGNADGVTSPSLDP